MPEGSAVLARALSDPDGEVAYGAAALLRAPARLDHIAPLLGDIAAALDRSNDLRSRQELGALFVDAFYPGTTLAQRAPAIDLLRRILVQQGMQLASGELRANQKTNAIGLVHLGLDSIESYRLLRRVAAREDFELDARRIAAWGMAISDWQPRTPEARDELKARLRHAEEDPLLRRYAARGLAAYLDRDAVEVLLDTLVAGDATARHASARSLAWMARTVAELPAPAAAGARDALPARLHERLRTERQAEPLVRMLDVVVRLPPDTGRSLPVALALLDHPSDEVVALALNWLFTLKTDVGFIGAVVERHRTLRPGVAQDGLALWLLTALSPLSDEQIAALPEAYRPVLRRVAEARGTQPGDLTEPAGRGSTWLEDDAPAWEAGPPLGASPASPAPAVAPLAVGLAGQASPAAAESPAATGPQALPALSARLASPADWREFTFPTRRVIDGKLFPDTPPDSWSLKAMVAARSDWAYRINNALDRAGDTWQARLRKFVGDNLAASIGVAALGTLSLGSLLLLGLYYRLARRPWRIVPWAQRLRAASTDRLNVFGLANVRLRALLRWLVCIAPFEDRPRTLDAWLQHHLGALQRSFAAIPAVQLRSQVHRRPLAVDGRAPQPFELADARRLLGTGDAAGDTRHTVLVIHGEGGSGKTTLACELARWAWAPNAAERLHPGHAIVPVLIERDLAAGLAQPSAQQVELKLVEAVRSELQRMLDGRHARVDDTLVRQLLAQRRLMVIVDHLSEMSEASRLLLERVGNADFPVRLLVLTSRFRENGIAGAHRVQTPQVAGAAAASELYWHFVRAEHVQRFGEPLRDDRYALALARLDELHLIVRDRSVSVLLVKLYADFVVSGFDAAGVAEMTPRSVPQVMQWHVRNSSRDAAKSQSAHSELLLLEESLADAKIVGWECVRPTLAPGKAWKDQLYAVLPARASGRHAQQRLEWLMVKASLVRQYDYGSTDEVTFVMDPLAEYLAAFHLADDARGEGRLLRQHGPALLALDGQASGFRRALDDCFADEFGQPFAALLASRYGIVGEAVATA